MSVGVIRIYKRKRQFGELLWSCWEVKGLEQGRFAGAIEFRSKRLEGELESWSALSVRSTLAGGALLGIAGGRRDYT